MRELTKPVRLDGAARVVIRVDERREAARRLDHVVEFEAKLSKHAEIWAESGGADHHIRRVLGGLAVAGSREHHAVAGVVETRTTDLKSIDELHSAGGDKSTDSAAEQCTAGESVVV